MTSSTKTIRRSLLLATSIAAMTAASPAAAETCLLDRNNNGEVDPGTDDDGGADAEGNGSQLACGVRAEASGDGSTAYGSRSTASGETSTAIGFRSEAVGDRTTAIGYISEASGINMALRSGRPVWPAV